MFMQSLMSIFKEKIKVLKTTSKQYLYHHYQQMKKKSLSQIFKKINSITINNIDNISKFIFNHNRTPNSISIFVYNL